MRVVPYDPKYKQDFIEMNMAWITQMFKMEAEDLCEMENIEPALAKGGQIFFAFDDAGKAMACCMIAPRDDGDWEIMKFAARGMYTGKGAGSACLKACIDYARNKGIPKILIVSNRKCTHAVKLYRRHGFTEIPVDRKKFPFGRADIAFEMKLQEIKNAGNRT